MTNPDMSRAHFAARLLVLAEGLRFAWDQVRFLTLQEDEAVGQFSDAHTVLCYAREVADALEALAGRLDPGGDGQEGP
jgi:hypothetical protein